MKITILVSIVFSFFSVRNCRQWNYDESGNSRGECQSGRTQSPIPLNTKYAVHGALPPIEFVNYDRPLNADIYNFKDTVNIQFVDSVQPSLRGDLLQADYSLDSIHFHWNAEHTINDRNYPLEGHLVHYKTSYGSLTKAQDFRDGVIVLAVVYLLSDIPSDVFHTITESMGGVPLLPNRTIELDTPITPRYLLPRNTDSFFTYEGSLTTPGYEEVVVWFVFPDPSHISAQQLNALTNINTADNRPVLDNARSLQPVNGRQVCFTNGLHRFGGYGRCPCLCRCHTRYQDNLIRNYYK
ncbi:hypothetical protein JTB14_018815 [Gonioctena quinquepunctata]|nr:hypothetical protein JTB14_018815 [Gonioctena quinquepunctata]